MSVAEKQTPEDDAAGAVAMPSVGVLEEQATPPDDDPGVAAIRAALAEGTAGSFKKSLNTCLIIWTVGRSRMPRAVGRSPVPRRRIWIPLTLIAPVIPAAVHYWPAFSDLVHHLH